MRAFRSASMADTGLNANAQMMAKKRMKLSALTMTQNRLIWNSVSPPSSAASCDDGVARAGGDGQDIHRD